MPQVLEQRVAKLLKRGMPESEAYGIATKQLQNAGTLKKGTNQLK